MLKLFPLNKGSKVAPSFKALPNYALAKVFGQKSLCVLSFRIEELRLSSKVCTL